MLTNARSCSPNIYTVFGSEIQEILRNLYEHLKNDQMLTSSFANTLVRIQKGASASCFPWKDSMIRLKQLIQVLTWSV